MSSCDDNRAEIICLAPPVVTLFVGLPRWNPPGNGEPWNIGVFFAFISLSRIGSSFRSLHSSSI